MTLDAMKVAEAVEAAKRVLAAVASYDDAIAYAVNRYGLNERERRALRARLEIDE